jgi:hypothetical protein
VVRARILALNVPRLLREVIGGVVAGYAGLELVGRQTRDVDAAIAALQPDVVILVCDSVSAEERLLVLRASHPALRVVALDADGRAATLYEPAASPRRISEVSPTMLLSLLRGGG